MNPEQEKKLIQLVQDDLIPGVRLFADLAQKLGAAEKDVLETLQAWHKKGLLRRFGVLLRHQKAGYRANAMSVWNVPDDKVEETGRKMIAFPEVGHCYQRPPLPDWPYTLYAMIHADSREEVERIAASIGQATGINDYELLFTEREFKKTSMQYFVNEIPMESED